MASSVTAPLERQFGQMPGLKQMTSTSSCGSSVDHAAVRPGARASTSPSRRCRRRSTPRSTFLPRDLPNPPVYSKVNPADAPILTLALTSQHAAAHRRSRTWPTRGSRRRSRSSPASAWSPSAAGSKPGGAHPGQPGARSPPTASAWKTCAPRSPPPTSTRPRAASTGRSSRSRSAPTISSCRAGEYRPLVVAYRNGAPVRLSDVADVIDGAENVAAGRVDERHARRSSSTSSASPAPTSSRSSTASSSCCRSSEPRCRRRSRSRCSPTAPTTIRASVRRTSSSS